MGHSFLKPHPGSAPPPPPPLPLPAGPGAGFGAGSAPRAVFCVLRGSSSPRQARARLHSERAFSEAPALLCAGLLACCGTGRRRAPLKEPHGGGPGGPGQLQVAPRGPRPRGGKPRNGAAGRGPGEPGRHPGDQAAPRSHTAPRRSPETPERAVTSLRPPAALRRLQASQGHRDLGESSFRMAGPGVLAVPDPQAVFNFLLCPPVDGGPPLCPSTTLASSCPSLSLEGWGGNAPRAAAQAW